MEKFTGKWSIKGWEDEFQPVPPLQICNGKNGRFFFSIRKTKNPKAIFNINFYGEELTSEGTTAEIDLMLMSPTGTNASRKFNALLTAACPTDIIYFYGIHTATLNQYINRHDEIVIAYTVRIVAKAEAEAAISFSLNPLDTDYLNVHGPNPVPVVNPAKSPSELPDATPRRLLLDSKDCGRTCFGVTGISSSDAIYAGFVPAVLQMIFNIPKLRYIILDTQDKDKKYPLLREIQKILTVLTDYEKTAICDRVVANLPWRIDNHNAVDLFSEVINIVAKLNGPSVLNSVLPTFILNNRDAHEITEAFNETAPPNIYPDILPVWPVKQRSHQPFTFTERITIGKDQTYVLHQVYTKENGEDAIFVRPTAEGDWIKFYGIKAERAIHKQVYDGNFKKQIVCLLYVKEESLKDVYDTEKDSKIDMKLKAATEQEMNQILEAQFQESNAKRSTEFIFFTEETLRYLARTNRQGFQSAETIGRVLIDINSSTEQVYFDVAEASNMPVDSIRLWVIEPDGKLAIVPLRKNITFRNVPTRKLFVQTKKIHDYLEVPDGYKMVFVKYFDPTSTEQIMTYIGSVIVAPTQAFGPFIDSVCKALRFKADTPLLAFNEKNGVQLNPTSVMAAQPVESAETIVFQADPSKCFPLPKIDPKYKKIFDCRTDLPRPTASESIPVNPLRLTGELLDVPTYSEHVKELKENLQVLAFNYNDYRVSPILLSLPDMLHLSDLELTIIKIAKLRFNKHSHFMVFFASDPEAGCIPKSTPLPMGDALKLSRLDRKNPVIFYMHVTDPQIMNQYNRLRTVHVKISRDTVNVNDQFSFFMDPNSTVGDVIDRLQRRGFDTSGNFRMYSEKYGTLVKTYTSKNDPLDVSDHVNLRIDITSNEEQGKKLIQVNFVDLDKSKFAHAKGTPFFISFTAEDTVGSFKKRICELTNNDVRNASALRIAFGKPGYKIIEDAYVKDEVSIETWIHEMNYDINDIVVLCVNSK